MTVKRKSLESLFEVQREFNNLIYGAEKLPTATREEITKSLFISQF